MFAIALAPLVRMAVNSFTDNLSVIKLFESSQLQNLASTYMSKVAFIFIILIIVAALLKGVFLFFVRQTIIINSRKIEEDLKNEIFEHYQKLSASFYGKNFTGDLMNRISEDVSKVRMYLGPAIMYSINLVVMMSMVISVMLSINVKITLLVLLPLPFLSIAIYVVSDIINKRSENIQKKLSNITSVVQETFSGIKVIKAFASENDFEKEFVQQSEEFKNENMKLEKVNALFFPIVLFLISLSILITVYFGGKSVIQGNFTYGNIAEFVIYVNMLTWPVASIGWVTSIIQQAAASQKRINEFLNTQPEQDPNKNFDLSFQNNLEFKNVSFAYDEENVLKNVSFNLKKGESLGIIGSIGSGKTTIAQLILKVFSAQQGSILLDGNDIDSLNTKAYRNLFAYSPQDVFLFNDTIANNLKFGSLNDNVSHQEILEAVKFANFDQEIEGFPKKYETILGQRGVTLSGGQRQRLALARAFLRKAQIYIIDDSLSAVDSQTEKHILKNINALGKENTLIVISHRMSAVEKLDKLLVLQNGRVEAFGSPIEIAPKDGYFKDMLALQSEKTEIESN